MSTQYTNGDWSETEPLSEALDTFQKGVESGTARRFIIGTKQEIEEEKRVIDLKEEVAKLCSRIESIEASSEIGLVRPTKEDIIKFGGAK